MTLIRAPQPDAIAEAGKLIKEGEVVVYPTETLYGLAADALNEDAVRRVFEMKGRGPHTPMPVIVADMEMLKEIVRRINSMAKRLMEAFWPGPLTMVFDAAPNLPELLTGGTASIGVRIPSSETALDLVYAAGGPITATSANATGAEPPPDPREAVSQLAQKPAMVIDAGMLEYVEPSTVVDIRVERIKILREGAIPRESILRALEGTRGF